MGNLFQDLASNVGFGGQTAQTALNNYQNQMTSARNALAPAYATANQQLTSGYQTAEDTARGGFQTARGDTSTGYGRAQQQLTEGGDKAIKTATTGYDKAQSYYDSPEMVSSRAELYNRALGKGGLDPTTLAKMKAGTREEYGTGMRGAEQALKSTYGDSGAQGLAGENLARAASTLGASRANATRDIDTGNAALARTEQGNAITSLGTEAGQRAGLSAQEANTVSGLQERLAEGGAGLTAQETNALAGIASQEGTTLADLQGRLAQGQAGLTTEEIKALTEMTNAQATGALTVGSQKNLLQSLWG